MPWNWGFDLKLSISMELVSKEIKLGTPLDLVKNGLAANFKVKHLAVGRVIANESWALKTESFEARIEQCKLQTLYLHNRLE